MSVWRQQIKRAVSSWRQDEAGASPERVSGLPASIPSSAATALIAAREGLADASDPLTRRLASLFDALGSGEAAALALIGLGLARFGDAVSQVDAAAALASTAREDLAQLTSLPLASLSAEDLDLALAEVTARTEAESTSRASVRDELISHLQAYIDTESLDGDGLDEIESALWLTNSSTELQELGQFAVELRDNVFSIQGPGSLGGAPPPVVSYAPQRPDLQPGAQTIARTDAGLEVSLPGGEVFEWAPDQALGGLWRTVAAAEGPSRERLAEVREALADSHERSLQLCLIIKLVDLIEEQLAVAARTLSMARAQLDRLDLLVELGWPSLTHELERLERIRGAVGEASASLTALASLSAGALSTRTLIDALPLSLSATLDARVEGEVSRCAESKALRCEIAASLHLAMSVASVEIGIRDGLSLSIPDLLPSGKAPSALLIELDGLIDTIAAALASAQGEVEGISARLCDAMDTGEWGAVSTLTAALASSLGTLRLFAQGVSYRLSVDAPTIPDGVSATLEAMSAMGLSAAVAATREMRLPAVVTMRAEEASWAGQIAKILERVAFATVDAGLAVRLSRHAATLRAHADRTRTHALWRDGMRARLVSGASRADLAEALFAEDCEIAEREEGLAARVRYD